MTGDDEIAVARAAAGARLRGPLRRLLAAALLLQDRGRPCAARFAEAFGPISFATSADCGAGEPAALLLRRRRPRAPRGRRGGARGSPTPLRHHLGRPRGAGARAGVRRARGPPALPALRARPRVAQRPVPRVDAARAGARATSAASRRSRAGSRCGVMPRTRRDGARSSSTRCAPLGLTDTLQTLQNLGLTVTEELRIPLALPEGRRRASCTASRSRRRPSASPRCSRARSASSNALRALDEERATDDPLNGLVLDGGPQLARGRGAAHAAQPPAADPHPLQRRDGQRRAAAQQRGRGRARTGRSPRASTPRVPGDRAAAVARGRGRLSRRRSSRCAAWPRTRCCAPSTT